MTPGPTAADAAPELGLAERDHLFIDGAALGKEYLLQANFIQQPQAPLGTSLRSRIVEFARRGDRVFLLQATEGSTVTHDFPQNLILASFPVVREDGSRIVFDFNDGMSRIFAARDWVAADLGSPQYQPDFQTVAVNDSFVDGVSADAAGGMVVRQFAQLDAPDSAGQRNSMTVEVQYELTPYVPDPTFVPTEAQPMDRMGFFEIAPRLAIGGDTRRFVTKFNLQRPVVYSLSSNIPAAFRQAVRDGVLYWNGVLGADALKVVDAPEGVAAPATGRNVIQWIDWPQAGFAFADAQMDPRTGEVRRAQVYVTSSFAFQGQNEARRFVRLFDAGDPPVALHMPSVALQGFVGPEPCGLAPDESAVTRVRTMLAEGATDDVLLEASRDYVREAVAHEVGHTLGLRHNFAGSLGLNYVLSAREGMFKDYLKHNGSSPGVVPTRSIMDYLPFEEALFAGDAIEQGAGVFDYDRMAIESLYLGKTPDRSTLPPFCTDGGMAKGQYVDCRPFDAGASIVEQAAQSERDLLDHLPQLVLEDYIAAKTVPPDFSPFPSPRTVDETTFHPDLFARQALAGQAALVTAFTKTGESIAVRRRFAAIDPLDEDEVHRAELQWLGEELARLGGIDALFATVGDDYASARGAELDALLERSPYVKGEGFEGRSFAFTPAEIESIRKTGRAVFAAMPEALLREQVRILSLPAPPPAPPQAPGAPPATPPAAPKVSDAPLGDDLARVIGEKMKALVLATTDERIAGVVTLPAKAGDGAAGTTRQVELPKFRYPQDLRVLAAGLLQKDRGESPAWGVAERAGVKHSLLTLCKTALGAAPADLAKDAADLSPDVARWVVENAAVLAAFPAP